MWVLTLGESQAAILPMVRACMSSMALAITSSEPDGLTFHLRSAVLTTSTSLLAFYSGWARPLA